DSGSLFYASVQGDMAALVGRLGAVPNADNSPAFGYAINAEYFKEVDPGSEDTDRMGVVIGRDQKQEGTFNFGCRRFDN
ncbi:MAG: hypothetical protein LBV45_03940, partial [Xanthomonadaceae bacterium]|nr:hypothetical protein [Xanthomonadaceae bacterium]